MMNAQETGSNVKFNGQVNMKDTIMVNGDARGTFIHGMTNDHDATKVYVVATCHKDRRVAA